MSIKLVVLKAITEVHVGEALGERLEINKSWLEINNLLILTAREITYNNFEISQVVFMPNITTNHALNNKIIQLTSKNTSVIETTSFQSEIDRSCVARKASETETFERRIQGYSHQS